MSGSTAECLFEVMKPSDYIGCLGNVFPFMWEVMFFAILTIMSIGFIVSIGLERGLAVVGFLGTLIAIAMFALEAISILLVFFPLVFLMAGVLLLIINK
jgi:hypothetical protein